MERPIYGRRTGMSPASAAAMLAAAKTGPTGVSAASRAAQARGRAIVTALVGGQLLAAIDQGALAAPAKPNRVR